MGARLVLKTVDAIAEGTAPSLPQSELVTYEALLPLAPKIFTGDCRIDWNQSVREVYNLIRGQMCIRDSLMIVSVVSYGTILIFEKHSIYAKRLAKRGELITHHKDKAVLTFLKIEELLEKDIPTVTPEMTLGEMVKVRCV